MTEGASRSARRRPSPAKLYGLIAVMVSLWSANYVVAKVALRDFEPLLLSGLRTTLASLSLLPVYFWNRRRRPPDARLRRDLPLLAALGVVGVALNQVLFVNGLSRTSVGHSALVIGMTPILVLLLAAFAGLERIGARKFLGMGIALGGIALLNLAPGRSAGASLLGDAFVFAASVTFSWFTVYGKLVTARHGAVVVSTAVYAGAALALAPVTIWHALGGSLARVTLAGWLSVFFMALFPSMVCYLIFAYALEHIPASRVSMFSYAQPVLATLIAIPVLGETVGGGLAAGGALVLAGVWITERA